MSKGDKLPARRKESDMSTIYSTRDEAIEREIVVAIEATGEATRDEFDIDAIADEVLIWEDGAGTAHPLNHQGYRVTDDTDFFWAVAQKHAR